MHHVRLHEIAVNLDRYFWDKWCSNCFVNINVDWKWNPIVQDDNTVVSTRWIIKYQAIKAIILWLNATLPVTLMTNNCYYKWILAQLFFLSVVCGHGVSMIMIMVSSCTQSVISWFQRHQVVIPSQTKLLSVCTFTSTVDHCLLFFSFSFFFLFSTGQSYEHAQSQCVFKDVK